MQLYRHRKISDDLLCLRNRDAKGAELEAAKVRLLFSDNCS
jgi:hypothetical protein